MKFGEFGTTRADWRERATKALVEISFLPDHEKAERLSEIMEECYGQSEKYQGDCEDQHCDDIGGCCHRKHVDE